MLNLKTSRKDLEDLISELDNCKIKLSDFEGMGMRGEETTLSRIENNPDTKKIIEKMNERYEDLLSNFDSLFEVIKENNDTILERLANNFIVAPKNKRERSLEYHEREQSSRRNSDLSFSLLFK